MLLQRDVNAISDWMKCNMLSLNVSKCKQMIITWKKQSDPLATLTVDGKPLELVHSYKYLGVWITSDLSWTKQIEESCKKANQKIGMLYRRFYKYCSTDTHKCLYITLIRPHLEYAVPVWDPHLIRHIAFLEKVQKFALKVCLKSWNTPYDTLLSIAQLPRLEQRRVQLKLSFLYQLVNIP